MVDVGTVVSLGLSAVALTFSISTSRRTQQTKTIQAATQLSMDVDKVFIEHPELRRYFYDSAPIPKDKSKDTSRLLAVGEYVLDCFECIWDHNKKSRVLDDRSAWESYIRGVYATSPVLGALYREFHTELEAVEEGSGWYPSLAELDLEHTQE